MKLFDTVDSIREYVTYLNGKQLTVGFVPTMGALHHGHLSLIRRAALENDRVAVSIFVNPIQFNNTLDLERYPRDLAADLVLLDPLLASEDFIFAPSVGEMYPVVDHQVFDFGTLAEVMEGRSRPGHFNGVGIAVNKFLRIIKPAKVYFGEKDFQQLAIIRELIRIEHLPVKIIPCEIVREPDGLAMSSRNVLLTPEHRRAAPLIFQTLTRAVENISSENPDQLKSFITSMLNQTGLLEVEYVEFADETTLMPVRNWSDSENIRCFIAVQAGTVRLIDNIRCFSNIQ